jgi:tryptophan halogenase
MVAAALSRVLGRMPGLSIALLESDAIGTIGVGEASIPDLTRFNRMLGLDEGAFLRDTRGTYKLGIQFVDWARRGHSYVHPFGAYGVDMEGIEFHHHWLRARGTGADMPLGAFSIAASAALAGRFMPGQADRPNSPLSRMGHAYQFDAGLYARLLRQLAEKQGVIRHEGMIAHATRDGQTGHLTALTLSDGRRMEADFFIDCTGFRSLLLGGAMGVPLSTGRTGCRATGPSPCPAPTRGSDRGAQPPHPLHRARGGVAMAHSLQHRIGNGHVYSSAFLSDEEALRTLSANLDGAPLADPNPIRFAAGHRAQAWVGNVVGIGLAGDFWSRWNPPPSIWFRRPSRGCWPLARRGFHPGRNRAIQPRNHARICRNPRFPDPALSRDRAG